ncbi:MAG: glycoside hydrolase family 2 TIM barrel-domain containing protein [Clostridia bacterium]|nr:glycoside hydrolase family 2 TIM barrel-domain containing protein [Clostridia bacterium]
MRRLEKLRQGWYFTGPDKKEIPVTLPHTWNNVDGQDGGNDYWRGSCAYRTSFSTPDYDPDNERVYLEFRGVNASADVTVNGEKCMRHDGGYSTFRRDITELLQPGKNELTVIADNSVNDRVYPQKADFTFYGGIYRDVNLIVVNKYHFDMDHFSGPGIRITAKPCEGYKRGDVEINTWTNCQEGDVTVRILDAEGKEAARGEGKELKLEIPDVQLWNGLESPYLYTAVATLTVDGEVKDEISSRFGVRDFHYHPKTGFYLNGKSYPLRGVSRHQDRKGVGNALTKEMHKEDMDLICEIGANTIRLAHYQHDQYFYDLCDERGMVVWAEIPYISEHMPNGRENTISQMKELIIQNYNHPSIVCWGVSNEITISTKDKKDMLDNHHVLNDLVHEMDKTRFTTLACYAMCGPFNKVAHITDVVSWNLYLGWYVPGLWLNDVWMRFFHMVYPDRCLGYSEYGCEGMPNLHSAHPRRGDHTEEYQARYHEYLLKCFERNPYMWATHVWNMFDFAADARNQGGEPGMNHKGLITFDRKTKKDSFYLYKAYWSQAPFVHICSKRFQDRTEKQLTVKVYSNQNEVTLYLNGEKKETKYGSHIFTFTVPLKDAAKIRVTSGECGDYAEFRHVDKPNPAYKLGKSGDNGANWTK